MSGQPRRMKFGVFIAPWHAIGEHPTLAIKRDMDLVVALEELGFDEAWIGEHHSYGRELISNPMIAIAALAERTKRIRLGTGVVSLPYHHPLMVADDLLQLDHMTQGRVMLGVGPGALTSDAYMMGIPTEMQRERQAEALAAIMHLARNEEPLTMKTDWFEMNEAKLQMAWYSDPHPEFATAVTVTPSGPTLAGKYGISLLSVAGADSDSFSRVWGWAEESAREHATQVDRKNWRVVVNLHLAETREEAIEDVRRGYANRAYYGDVRDAEQRVGGIFGDATDDIEVAMQARSVIIGTPEDAIKKIQDLVDLSGGFGTILCFAHEWAPTHKIMKSYELLMRYVAPVFQGHMDRLTWARDFVEDNRRGIFGATPAAMLKAFQDANKELPDVLKQGFAALQAQREKAEASKQS
ncbi:MAG: LLM class flavin-dependent oxidoreductase [Dehalococcoidia bacterium]|nr:LLM class flavin-dependent oxidoreductase [Dehalococcoidia bacterium]